MGTFLDTPFTGICCARSDACHCGTARVPLACLLLGWCWLIVRPLLSCLPLWPCLAVACKYTATVALVCRGSLACLVVACLPATSALLRCCLLACLPVCLPPWPCFALACLLACLPPESGDSSLVRARDL